MRARNEQHCRKGRSNAAFTIANGQRSVIWGLIGVWIGGRYESADFFRRFFKSGNSLRLDHIRFDGLTLGTFGERRNPPGADSASRSFERMRRDLPIAISFSFAERFDRLRQLADEKMQHFLLETHITHRVAAQVLEIDGLIAPRIGRAAVLVLV